MLLWKVSMSCRSSGTFVHGCCVLLFCVQAAEMWNPLLWRIKAAMAKRSRAFGTVERDEGRQQMKWGTRLRAGEMKTDNWVKKLKKFADQRKGCSCLHTHTHTPKEARACGISKHIIPLLETLITLLSNMSFTQPVAQSSAVDVSQWKKSHFGWTCFDLIMESKFHGESRLSHQKMRCFSEN